MTINKKQMEEIEKIVLRILIDKKSGDSVRVEYKRDFDGRIRVVDDYFVRLESAHIIKKRKFTDKDGIDFDLLRGFCNKPLRYQKKLEIHKPNRDFPMRTNMNLTGVTTYECC